MSKGDWRRPSKVSQEELDARWEKAFGKKEQQDEQARVSERRGKRDGRGRDPEGEKLIP